MTAEPLIESRLFYRTDPSAVLKDLPEALTQAYAQSNLQVRLLFEHGGDLVFGIGELTLSVTCAIQGLDQSQLENAKRPECANTLAAELRDRLRLHRSAVAIRITGPARAAKPETRLALTYIATMQLLNLAQPDLLHWMKTDTLYTIEEFRSSTGAHRPVRPRAVIAAPHRTARTAPRPQIPTENKGRSFVPGALSNVVPGKTPSPATRLKRALERGAIAGLTAPLSVGYLLQHLMPGGKFG